MGIEATTESFPAWRDAGDAVEAAAAVAMVDEAVTAATETDNRAPASIDVVSSGPVWDSVNRRDDRPFDSGYRYEGADEALRMAKREALGRTAIPSDCEVSFVASVPFSGTEPLVDVVVRQPDNYPNYPA